MASKRDYYVILGVDKEASEDQIKQSFRSLARKYHPDKNPNNPEAESKFKEIQEAYAILSNPEERRNYDVFGHERPGGSPFGSRGFQGVDISFDDLFGGGFESIFSQFFGGQQEDRTRGSDLLVRHSVPFQASMDGLEDEIEIEPKELSLIDEKSKKIINDFLNKIKETSLLNKETLEKHFNKIIDVVNKQERMTI